jgi:hypothetical protein
MVDDRGTSLKLDGSRCRDTKSQAMLHAEPMIPRSLSGEGPGTSTRACRRSKRSTALAFPALSRLALVLPARPRTYGCACPR